MIDVNHKPRVLDVFGVVLSRLVDRLSSYYQFCFGTHPSDFHPLAVLFTGSPQDPLVLKIVIVGMGIFIVVEEEGFLSSYPVVGCGIHGS